MFQATTNQIEKFKAEVWGYYRAHGRDLPWRRTHDAYPILVSEVMLQQTQVIRVVPKYAQFLDAFPTPYLLAGAPVAEVLTVWQGLGYNRRALALHQTAKIIDSERQGAIPRSVAELRRLPGIGQATAAAVCVYAYDLATPFIETNVRSAFIHFFFQECSRVSDAEILPLVELTLDRDRPRDWYYALMDYGAWVKKTHANPGRKSKHHAVQSPFAGSRREARAAALRVLLSSAAGGLTLDELVLADAGLGRRDRDEVHAILASLTSEGFLICETGRFRVA